MQSGGEQPGDHIEQDLFMAHQDKLQTARISQPADNQEPSNVPMSVPFDALMAELFILDNMKKSLLRQRAIPASSTPGGVRL